jgi:hypothetical protein
MVKKAKAGKVAKKVNPKFPIPRGFKRPRKLAAADAHLMVARTAATMGPPPYICTPTGPPPAPCLRYGLDRNTGEYSIPPYGVPMDCAACRAGRSG